MIKEALQYIIGLSQPRTEEIYGETYYFHNDNHFIFRILEHGLHLNDERFLVNKFVARCLKRMVARGNSGPCIA